MDNPKNQAFLHAVECSFRVYLEKGSSRSNAKLKPLHGFIAQDLHERLGPDYAIFSQGYEKDHEEKLPGRYQSKAADVSVFRNGIPIAGIAVKFVMQNYKQNSVNYFENMLGETANVRCAGIPYFQILIILDRLPYFDKNNGQLKRWKQLTSHNIDKYVTLSKDDPTCFMHTPDRMLIFVIHSHEAPELTTKQAYFDFYRFHPELRMTSENFGGFGRGVVLNDYDFFMTKISHAILAF